MKCIQNYPTVNYRSLRAQLTRKQFPDWFNHLIVQGFFSPGLTEAAKHDKSIAQRLQQFFSIVNIPATSLAQHQPLAINPATESVAIAALAAEPKQTEISLIYLERNCQYVFVTKAEEQALIAPPPTQSQSKPVQLGAVPTSDHNPCYTAPPTRGGIIVHGIIEKTASQDRITLWKRRGHWQTFYLPRGLDIRTGEKLTLEIDNGHVSIIASSGTPIGKVDLVDQQGNPEIGLRIERFGPYLPWAGQIVGQFYKQFSSIGELKIGRQTLRYPDLANEIARINFFFGLASLFYLTTAGQEHFLTSFFLQTRPANPRNVLKQELASTFSGYLTRTVGEKGLFSLGHRDLYIDTQFAPSGTHILLIIVNGEVTEIWHEQSYQIPLTALRMIPFYDTSGQSQSLITGQEKRLATSFKEQSGFWQVPNGEKGTVLYFAQEKHLLRPGYGVRFVQILYGKVVGLRYYYDPKATPDLPPDQEDVYKRLFINDKLILCRRSKFEKSHFTAVKPTDTITITHWKIPNSGMIELRAKNIRQQSLDAYAGKYIILTLSSSGNTLNIYDQPETDPNKTPLRSIRL